MSIISRDSPALFITAVTKDRLPVFRTSKLTAIACEALNESRTSGNFAVFAYVMMPDHIHVLTDAARKPSEILRFIKGIISHRVIDYLKENDYRISLAKLRHERKERQYIHSLWQHHSNVLLITSESILSQRASYIHQNPVRSGLVERAEDYRWSSVRCWNNRPSSDEPLITDKVDKRGGKWQGVALP